MISQTADYALRAIVFLANHTTESKTVEVIARETQVPMGYLAKIMHSLAKGGLVESQRGPYGGFKLNSDPQTMTVYDVLQSIDPINRITECPMRFEAHGTSLCPLHRSLDNAMAVNETAFKQMTIYQMLNQPDTNRPLCPFPRPRNHND